MKNIFVYITTFLAGIGFIAMFVVMGYLVGSL